MLAMRYSLKDINDIIFNGFEISLPNETLSMISELALQVGSPTYIRTPTFYKKEHPNKNSGSYDDNSSGGNGFKKNKRGNRSSLDGNSNDEDWESIRSFQATKLEQKVGIDAQIDLLRSSLNKMSDKNYNDSYGKITEILNQLIKEETSPENMLKIGNAIFEIASNNRFYSKLYADLYTSLIHNYEIMRTIFETNLNSFMELFNCIEHADPDQDYDKFCKVNKNNERRKAFSLFFVNLKKNGIISEDRLIELIYGLLQQLTSFILIENKKDEVDELTENIAILYDKNLFEKCPNKIGDETFPQIINRLAHSKVKTYSSLSNKSIFKFMDLIEM